MTFKDRFLVIVDEHFYYTPTPKPTVLSKEGLDSCTGPKGSFLAALQTKGLIRDSD